MGIFTTFAFDLEDTDFTYHLLNTSDYPADLRKLSVEQLPEQFGASEAAQPPSPAPGLSLEENNFELIRKALKQCNGNRTAAAKLLGISRRTLHRRLAEMGDVAE